MEELLKTPAKYSKTGIKIKCLKCKWQLGKGKCYENKEKTKSIHRCVNKDQHKYNLVVCIPNSKSRRMKIIHTRDFESALVEMKLFREELKINKYQKSELSHFEIQRTTFFALATEYLDTLSGINTRAQLIRKRSENHINDNRRVIERFGLSLNSKGYNLEILDLKDVTDAEVEIFHYYLLEELGLGKTTYNRYFIIMKAFFNWVIKVKEYRVSNPFAHAQLTFTSKEKTIITKIEFQKLIEAVTYENGFTNKHNESRNYYRAWLPYAFRLGLETGTRAEELVELKWSDILELENGIKVFKIQNLKVNRIQTGEDMGRNIRYIPITKGLNALLIELGLKANEGKNSYVLERELNHSTKYMMQIISRAFGHFISKASTRKIEFKDLRKTYITKLTMALGDDAKMYTGHANNEIIKQHYLSNAYLTGNLKDFDVL